MTTQGFKGSRGCGLLSLKQHDLCPCRFWLRPSKWASIITFFCHSAANEFWSSQSNLLYKHYFYWVRENTLIRVTFSRMQRCEDVLYFTAFRVCRRFRLVKRPSRERNVTTCRVANQVLSDRHFNNNIIAWLTLSSPLLTLIRSNTAQTPVLLTSTHHGRGGAEDVFWMAVISILWGSLWDIPRWFCTVFRFFLLLHDQRPKLLIRTSKGSLLFCWREHWQDSGGAMIITAPIWCPWNWHQQPVAPSGQEERRDSWTV